MPSLTFFPTPAAWRKWLTVNHTKKTEMLVGFYKTASGKPSMTWPESVDEALCFGWIDSVRKSIDNTSYSIRFSVRKPSSIWSQINLRKVDQLIASGKMQPAGLAIFQSRDLTKVNRYSFEQATLAFDEASQTSFAARKEAWAFYQAQSPTYRKQTTWWVMGAKQPATRLKRLTKLIEQTEKGLRIR